MKFYRFPVTSTERSILTVHTNSEEEARREAQRIVDSLLASTNEHRHRHLTMVVGELIEEESEAHG